MKFKLNDRVKIKEDYFMPYLRGKIGKISKRPENLLQNPDSLWIEFDSFIPNPDNGLTDALEVFEDEIELIEDKKT